MKVVWWHSKLLELELVIFLDLIWSRHSIYWNNMYTFANKNVFNLLKFYLLMNCSETINLLVIARFALFVSFMILYLHNPANEIGTINVYIQNIKSMYIGWIIYSPKTPNTFPYYLLYYVFLLMVKYVQCILSTM